MTGLSPIERSFIDELAKELGKGVVMHNPKRQPRTTLHLGQDEPIWPTQKPRGSSIARHRTSGASSDRYS